MDWPISIRPEDIVASVVVPGNPVAHQRPRVTRSGHTYTPAPTVEYKKMVATYVQSAAVRRLAGSAYGVQARFYRSNRQRVDVDNLLKSILDGSTQAGIWKDDSEVMEIAARLFRADPNPRAEFVIYILEPQAIPLFPSSTNCLRCGKEIRSYKTNPRKWCSRECMGLALRASVICSHCKKEFVALRCATRRKRVRPYCSRACSIAGFQELKRIEGKESDKWVCQECGGRVSRKEYVRCRACSIKQRQPPKSNYWLTHGTFKLTAQG
jgi:Holliday junction resolvase RusA-like endonuclease